MDSKYLVYLVIAVIGIMFLSGCAGEDTQVQNTPISASDLAKCLAANGAKVYGASSCSHCQDQKALFGEEWGLIDYIECEVLDDPGAQNVECSKAGITAYPTWVFRDGQIAQGKRKIEELWQMAGCPATIAAPNIGAEPADERAPYDEEDPSKSTESAIAEPLPFKEESMTYQIDVDATLNYVGTPEYDGGYNGYDEHIAFSTQKTIIRKYEREKFEAGWYDVKHPVQVSIEGYSDASCMKGGEIHKVRGTYSSQVYDGTFNIYMSYHDEKSSDNPADHGLRIFFSQIEGLPRLEEKGLTCIPSPSDVGETELASKVNGLLDATTSVESQMEDIATNMGGGPIFKSKDGGVLDVSGPIIVDNGRGEALEGYTWSGSISVKRIS